MNSELFDVSLKFPFWKAEGDYLETKVLNRPKKARDVALSEMDRVAAEIEGWLMRLRRKPSTEG